MKTLNLFAGALALLLPLVAPAANEVSGYKVIEKDGKKLYCSKRLATGSHLKQQKTCLTQEELDELKARTEQTMRENSRMAPPPQARDGRGG